AFSSRLDDTAGSAQRIGCCRRERTRRFPRTFEVVPSAPAIAARGITTEMLDWCSRPKICRPTQLRDRRMSADVNNAPLCCFLGRGPRLRRELKHRRLLTLNQACQ